MRPFDRVLAARRDGRYSVVTRTVVQAKTLDGLRSLSWVRRCEPLGIEHDSFRLCRLQ